jgi:holo-[acyl-carrier protein] synthase
VTTRLAVGVDVVEVGEVQSALAEFGDRYLNRVFTPHEVACATSEGEVQARRLAARFAAKEAAMKAIGSRSDRLPSWRSIEVRQEGGDLYTLRLSGHAATLARRARLSEFAVSLNQEGGLASAVVLALVNGET